MSELISSFVTLFFAELGDKTQLLTILLILRYRYVIPILFGIFIATITSQLLVSGAGAYFAGFLNPDFLNWTISLSFIVGGILCLLPEDEAHEIKEENNNETFLKIVLISSVTFFFYELGDKTQILTAVLAAKYNSVLLITLGSTIGMMAVNTPSAIIGRKYINMIPTNAIKYISSLIFITLGVYSLVP